MKMVELMAREMCKVDGFDWDELTNPMKNASGGDNDQEGYLVHAVAALRAMREPSDSMIDAGLSYEGGGHDDPCNRAIQSKSFSAMIDAAIKEAESE